MFKRKIVQVIAGLLITTGSFAQKANTTTNYLNISAPVLFNKLPYNLSWSSHPTDAYYKQEYLAQGDNLDRFKRLLSIDVLAGDIKLTDVVASKVNELKQLKEKNPIVNYQLFEKKDEILLDFLLSQNTPDGNDVSILERNVYRYKSIVTADGKKAILLFAVSDRAYDKEIEAFLTNLKGHKQELVNTVIAFKLPEISIAK